MTNEEIKESIEKRVGQIRDKADQLARDYKNKNSNVAADLFFMLIELEAQEKIKSMLLEALVRNTSENYADAVLERAEQAADSVRTGL